MVQPHPHASTTPHVPFLVGGHWLASRSGRSGPVYNPSTGKVIATVPFCTAEEVDRVVQTAAAAFPAWAETPIVDRARVMFRFRQNGWPSMPTSSRHWSHASTARRSPRRRPRCSAGSRWSNSPAESPASHGADARQHRPAGRLRNRSPPARRLRGHHAVQLPGDGAALDVPGRDHLRQHVRAQTLREGAPFSRAPGRAARSSRGCPKVSSASSTATASAPEPCWHTRWCVRCRSSARPRSRDRSTKTARGTASACRLPAGPRII